MMEAYKSHIEAALKVQQDATASLRAHVDANLTKRDSIPVNLDAPYESTSHYTAAKIVNSDERTSDSDGSFDELGTPPPKGLGTPIATLRKKLSAFAHGFEVGSNFP